MAGIVFVSASIAGLGGYALGRVRGSSASNTPARVSAIAEDDSFAPDEGLARDDGLRECEARLASAEEALAQRPMIEHAAMDPASMSEETRAAIATPDVSRAIDAEVERRIAERFERERARRQAEWAARREETRERLRAIGIDDATIAEVTPTMCAIRDVYRSAWQSGRGSGGVAGGDGGVRMGRREIREATRGLRDEVESTLGTERTARLEDEGGLRALGAAVDCGEGGPPGAPRR
jgi:hypothetical protein